MINTTAKPAGFIFIFPAGLIYIIAASGLEMYGCCSNEL